MTSDSDDLERQFRQSLKRLEAELARSNGIAAEKQNDEQLKRLEAELAGAVGITAEKQNDERLEAELARSNGIAAEKQNDEQLKRLEAELAGAVGITAEKQNDERLEAELARSGITAEKQNDQIAYLFGRVLYWTCFIVAGGLAACGLLAGIVKPKNWADLNFYLLFAVPAVGFLGLGLASRYTQALLKLLMRL